jgi:hypothetical protein
MTRRRRASVHVDTPRSAPPDTGIVCFPLPDIYTDVETVPQLVARLLKRIQALYEPSLARARSLAARQ